MKELWKSYRLNTNYEVSNLGRVREVKTKKPVKTYVHKSKRVRSPYETVHIKINGTNTTKYLHRMVLETFIGPCPKEHECCHKDGHSLNNKLSNLKWGTPKENSYHRFLHGVQPMGEDAGPAKFTNEDAVCVRVLNRNKVPSPAISKLTGISQSHVTGIIRGEYYKHIKVISQTNKKEK
jgi:hypothetical protein